MIAFKFLWVLLSLSLVLLGTQAHFDTLPANLMNGFVHFPNGIRQVSWIYSSNGLVVYDGDIIFSTIAQFNAMLMNITYSSDGSSLSRRHDIASQGLATRSYSEPLAPNGHLWPGGTIFYCYFDSSIKAVISTEVNFAISTWTAAMPCIRFVRLPNDNTPGGANGIVMIQFDAPMCLHQQNLGELSSMWQGCAVP